MPDLIPRPPERPSRLQAFGALLARVWLCFPRCGKIDTHQLEAYWLVLQAVPIPVLTEVARRMLERRPAPDVVPSAAEWLELATLVAGEMQLHDREDLKLLPLPKTGYHCDRCQDTGWRPSTVQANAVAFCECRPTNPIYQQTRTATPRYRMPRRTPDAQADQRDGRTRSSGDDD